MAQDVIGRGDVEEELGHAESEQQRPPGEVRWCAVLEGEYDFLVPGASISSRGRPCMNSTAAVDPGFQPGNIRFDTAEASGSRPASSALATTA